MLPGEFGSLLVSSVLCIELTQVSAAIAFALELQEDVPFVESSVQFEEVALASAVPLATVVSAPLAPSAPAASEEESEPAADGFP